MYQATECFLRQRNWLGKAEIDDELFFQFLEDMLVDVMRLKFFHEIDHINKVKQRAYAASWWLRRKPFFFKEAHDKSTVWANELFSLSLLLSTLPEDIYKSGSYDRQRASEAARHLFYSSEVQKHESANTGIVFDGV